MVPQTAARYPTQWVMLPTIPAGHCGTPSASGRIAVGGMPSRLEPRRVAGARAHRGELATTLDDRVGDRRCFFGEHRRRRRVVERFHACRSRVSASQRDCWRQPATRHGTAIQDPFSTPPPGARRSTCNYPFKVFRNCQDLSEHRLLKDTRRRRPDGGSPCVRVGLRNGVPPGSCRSADVRCFGPE